MFVKVNMKRKGVNINFRNRVQHEVLIFSGAFHSANLSHINSSWIKARRTLVHNSYERGKVPPQVRRLHHLAAGAVRGPEGGGDLPADQELRQQGHQLHARHPRLQDEVRRPREVPVRPPQEIW